MAILAAVSLTAPAQSPIFGSLSGTVNDSAGAVIPGAVIHLIHEGTQDRRTVNTDSNGLYLFPNLQPATYRLEAEATGFKRFVRTQIALGVNQAAQIDLRMEVGTVNETIEVTIARDAVAERMIRGGGWKYAVYADGEKFLYDLASDSGETRNLAGERSQQSRKQDLRRQLQA